MISIPLLTLFYEMRFIIPVETIFEVVLSVILVPKVISKVDKKLFALLVVGAVVGMTLGIQILLEAPSGILRPMLGVFVVAAGLRFLLKHEVTQKKVSRGWGLVAGFIGGLCAGMFGAGGPMYVIYLTYQLTDIRVVRATLIVLFACTSVYRLGLYVYTDMLGSEGLLLAAYLAPVVVVATYAGQHMQLNISDLTLRRVIAALLAVAGILCFY